MNTFKKILYFFDYGEQHTFKIECVLFLFNIFVILFFFDLFYFYS